MTARKPGGMPPVHPAAVPVLDFIEGLIEERKREIGDESIARRGYKDVIETTRYRNAKMAEARKLLAALEEALCPKKTSAGP